MGRPKLPEAFRGGGGSVSGGYEGEGEGMRTPNIATLWMLSISWAVLRAVNICVDLERWEVGSLVLETIWEQCKPVERRPEIGIVDLVKRLLTAL